MRVEIQAVGDRAELGGPRSSPASYSAPDALALQVGKPTDVQRNCGHSRPVIKDDLAHNCPGKERVVLVS